MTSILNILRDKVEPTVIPSDTPFLSRWGVQGISTASKYKKLEQLLENPIIHEESEVILNAHEDLLAAQFSCLYGRKENAEFRSIINRLEVSGLFSKKLLRIFTSGRNLRVLEKSRLKVHPPYFLALAGIILISFCILYFVAWGLPLFSASIPIVNKSLALLFVSFITIGCGCLFYNDSISPFITSIKYKKIIENYAIFSLNRNIYQNR